MLRFHEPRRRGTNHSEQQQLPPGWEFIDLAGLGSNTAHSYAAALARTISYPLAVAAVLGAVAGIGHLSGSSAAAVGVLLQYGPIVVAGGAVLYSVERSHRRPWLSSIALDRRIDWRRLAIGCGVELAIVLGQLALIHAVTGWPWKFVLPAALPLVAVTLLLIPLQAASEEILFRGYLTQALGRVLRSRVLIVLIVALVFGMLHFNAYGPLTLPYFFVLSLIFSLVSLRDDRLELVIGGHSAMNSFAVVTASFSPLAPGIVGIEEGALPFNAAAIVVLLVNGALFYGLTRPLVRLFCERRAAP